MENTAKTVCGHCGGIIDVEYIRLGVSVVCPHCQRDTIPEVPVGGSIPMSGYALTFQDFRRLLDDAGDRRAVAPLLEKWFGVTVTERDGAAVVEKEGAKVDRLELHLRVQSDPKSQYDLYQVAMSLWR